MPTSLMNAKFLAEVYLSRIREHRSRVKKTMARIHKASMGHTVNLTITNFFIHKFISMITTNTNPLHGLRGPAFLQVIIPPLWICNSIKLGYRGDVSFELLS